MTAGPSLPSEAVTSLGVAQRPLVSLVTKTPPGSACLADDQGAGLFAADPARCAITSSRARQDRDPGGSERAALRRGDLLRSAPDAIDLAQHEHARGPAIARPGARHRVDRRGAWHAARLAQDTVHLADDVSLRLAATRAAVDVKEPAGAAVARRGARHRGQRRVARSG